MNSIFQHIQGPILITPGAARLVMASIEAASNSFTPTILVDEIIKAQQSFKLELTNFSASAGTLSSTPQPKYVGVVNIVSPVTKYDQECGPRGMVSKEEEIKSLLQDDEVAGIILRLDTPGGQASYIDIISNTIRNANKPVLAYVEGGAYSAGYWLASACQEIYLSSKQDGVGSIGAYTTIADFSKRFEKLGIKVMEVYAPQSTEKNKAYKDLMQDEPDETLLKEDLGELVDLFIASVNINRSITDEKALAGATFRGDKAISVGLADGYKSLQQVAERVMELSSNKNQNKNSKMNTTEKKYPKTTAVAFGADAVDTIVLTEGNASLSEEALDNIETQLEEGAALATETERANNLQTQLDAANARIGVLEPVVNAVATTVGAEVPNDEASSTSLVESLNAFATEHSEWSKLPGAATSDAKPEETYTHDEKPVYAHVQAAKSALGK